MYSFPAPGNIPGFKSKDRFGKSREGTQGSYKVSGVILTGLRDPPPGGGAGGQAGSGK